MIEGPGQIQRFEVLGHIGTGGMGSVYRAHDPQLDRVVAIKVLAGAGHDAGSTLSTDATLDLRSSPRVDTNGMLDEARMMARLSHPNVLPVYEVGLTGDAMFVVMEYVEGCDLERWLEREHPLADILAVFANAGRGLAAAHASGVVHRDFKPANVLIGSDGRVRVADFGIARLAASPEAMVRVADTRGTPHYMAPEVFRGEPGTQQSDVFAFCTALRDTIGERPEVSKRLRAAIARGLSPDPAARPLLVEVLAAIEGRRSHWRWAAVALGAGAVATIAVLVAAVGIDRTPATATCDANHPRFAVPWDDQRRTEFRTAFHEQRSADVTRAIATLDRRRSGIGDLLRQTCAATRDGGLTDEQSRIRQSCLERRAIGFGVAHTHMLADKPKNIDLVAETIADPEQCLDLKAPPIVNRGVTEALYIQFATSMKGPRDQWVPRADAIRRAAELAGEDELAVRATTRIGILRRTGDDLAGANQTLERAYRAAFELGATYLATLALVERSSTALQRGDAKSAHSLAELAVDGSNKAHILPRMRAYAYFNLARTELRSGHPTAAVPHLDKALEVITSAHQPYKLYETQIRFDLINALRQTGKHDQALELAQKTLAFAKDAWGERSLQTAEALSMLGTELQAAGKLDEAIRDHRAALDTMVAVLPPGRSNITSQRFEVATVLVDAGQLKEALRELETIQTELVRNQALRAMEPAVDLTLGRVLFELGRFDDSIRIENKGFEATLSQFGLDHPATIQARLQLTSHLLELGHLDGAEHHVNGIERAYQADAKANAIPLAKLHGSMLAELVRARGKLARADRIARAAITTLSKAKDRDPAELVPIWLEVAAIKIDRRRYRDANTALAKAEQLARSDAHAETWLALATLQRARIEARAGHRRKATKLARTIKPVLDREHAFVRARGQLARLIAGKAP